MGKALHPQSGYDRPARLLLAIFIAAIALAAFWQWAHGRATARGNDAGAAIPAASYSTGASSVGAGSPRADAQAPATSATDAQMNDVAAQLSGEDAARLGELLSAATSHKKEQARAKAVFKLRDFETAQVADALAGIAASDESSRVRGMAIQSLKAVGMRSTDPDGRVRNALSLATGDRDPEVAADARAAYEEIDGLQSGQ